MVRSLSWVSLLTPLVARESVSLEGVRARALQVCPAERAAARQWPAQSPVAPKKARVLRVMGADMVVGGEVGIGFLKDGWAV